MSSARNSLFWTNFYGTVMSPDDGSNTLKRLSICTILHGATTQKTIIFILADMRIWNLNLCPIFLNLVKSVHWSNCLTAVTFPPCFCHFDDKQALAERSWEISSSASGNASIWWPDSTETCVCAYGPQERDANWLWYRHEKNCWHRPICWTQHELQNMILNVINRHERQINFSGLIAKYRGWRSFIFELFRLEFRTKNSFLTDCDNNKILVNYPSSNFN
jgi:hypothetical protein